MNDKFNYASNAAFQAVWGSAGAGSLDTVNGNPGSSAAHPGGAINSITFAPVQPTDANPLFASVDIRDDGTSDNKRFSFGLRYSGGANLVELGDWNDPGYYSFRHVLFETGDVNWVTFDTTASGIANAPAVRWNRYTVTIGGTSTKYTLDIGADGTIDASATVVSQPTTDGINQVRFGGPSGLSSAGGGGNIDNVLVQTLPVPEPTVLALLPLAAIAGRRARRR